MEEDVKKEILKAIDNIKFGKVIVELNETADHVDIISEKRYRIPKKRINIKGVDVKEMKNIQG